MKCFKCKKETELEIHHLGIICSFCFEEVIEKRVRKEIKDFGWLKKDDLVVILNDGSPEAAMSEYLIKTVVKGLPFTVEKKKDLQDIPLNAKIVLPWSAEKESNDTLLNLFNNKLEVNNKFLKLLQSISEEEIDAFCKIKNLSGTRKPAKDLLAKFEKRYPGTRVAFLKGIKEFIS